MKIENILIVVSAAIAIVFILWYIFGQSPTLEQVILTLMTFILTALLFNIGLTFKIWGDLQHHIGEHKGSDKN